MARDAPGCGRSSDPPASFRLPDYADCLARFIDELGLRRPHVLGLSFGGGLALELYRRHPTIPRSLVLASAYAGWAGSLPPEEVEQRLARVLREAELPAEVDALDEQAVDKQVSAVVEKAGGIDISFSAIGIPNEGIQGIPLVQLPAESFALPITTYTRAHFLTARSAARHMIGDPA